MCSLYRAVIMCLYIKTSAQDAVTERLELLALWWLWRMQWTSFAYYFTSADRAFSRWRQWHWAIHNECRKICPCRGNLTSTDQFSASHYNYSYNKTNQMHQFLKFIFGKWNLHVSDRFSVHHQEYTLYTQHWLYVIQGLLNFADCFLASSQKTLYVLLYLQC